MKTLKTLVLFLAAAMFIVACGTTDPVNGDPDPTEGTLVVNVTDSGGDPLTATIVVSDSDGDEVDSQTDSSFTWNVAPGNYSVSVSATGYQAATQGATIAAGSTSTLNFQLAAVDTATDEGTLFVSVSDGTAPLEASIVVSDADGDEVDTQTASAYLWEDMLPSGVYTVSVSAPGFMTKSEQVFIAPGGSASVFVTLASEADVINGAVGDIQLTFKDIDGKDFATAIDPSSDFSAAKTVVLVAQTEEPVCVAVEVTNKDGERLRNAPVNVSITGGRAPSPDRAVIVPGKCGVTGAAAGSGILTDGDGMAHFQVFATVSNVGRGDPEAHPLKIVVSVIGEDNVAPIVEFKAWFINMTHLWLAELTGEMGDIVGDLDIDEDYANTRLDHDFGEIFNVWELGIGSDNTHWFGTFALDKQPVAGPFVVGYGLDDHFDAYFDVNDLVVEGFGSPIKVQPTYSSDDGFPGFMLYEMIGGDTDLVSWEMGDDECYDVSADGLACIDDIFNGDLYVGVGLTPSGDLEELPISVEIKATYYFVIEYGEDVYALPLKDYTFTKTWIGGYLVVDKFVDQHVLTWAGESVTGAAAEDALSDIDDNFGEQYTSKVHVVVSNPSQSTMYNISVRDVVPAELGVVTDEISDGGTYDALNHAVTWNNVPELDALAPGEHFVLTFDVYARHKPGYCWDPDAVYGDIAPLLPPVGTDQLCSPYDDPYDVTNGTAYQDSSGNTLLGVSASAQFEDDEAQPQVQFFYQPLADESTIWVVRPLFAIDKSLVSPDVMNVGATAIFNITARQIDRVSTLVDDDNTEYAFLYDRYPWEFTGTLLEDEDFHAVDRDQNGFFEAPSGVTVAVDGSDVRDNPYARNVAVTDAFDYALDFTSGLDFPDADGNQALIVQASDKVVGKTVSFDPIVNLPRGELKTAVIRLTGQLPSDDLANAPAGSAQNGAIAQLTTDGLYAWQNCAYLWAPQLNQPHPVNPTFTDTIYNLWPTGYPTTYGESDLWIPWHQIDGQYQFGTDLVPSATGTPFVPDGATAPWAAVDANTRIESCDVVAIVPLPPAPFLGINVDGEHETVTFNDATGELILQGRRDGFTVGEDFFYVYSVENSGGGDALNVLIEIDRTNNRTAFTGSPAVYTTTTPRLLASTYAEQTANVYYNLTADTAGSKHLTVPTLEADEVIVIVIPASANQVGGQTITLQVPSYDNPPVYQDFAFLVSTDSTSVAP